MRRARQAPRQTNPSSDNVGERQLPPVMNGKIVGRSKNGDVIAEPLEWMRETSGPAPRIVILPAQGRRSGPAPGAGDVVLLRILRSNKGDGYVGRILKRLGRGNERRIGLMQAIAGQPAQIIAIEKRAAGRSWFVKAQDINGARDGDLVSFEAINAQRTARQSAKVAEILGRMDNPKAMSTIAIAQHGLPFRFSSEALSEAKNAVLGNVRREDWREMPLITIDPADARDHDDAVHAEPDPDPANPGGFIITLAIADVAAFVPIGSALDREARERGNSVYFPDQVVPMLPERLSNDLCSLKVGEDRAALAFRLIIDAHGKKRVQGLHRILMRSAAKLSYGQAQAAIDGDVTAVPIALCQNVLRPLWAAYRALACARDIRAPLALDLAERKLVLGADGLLEKVIVPPRLEAHRLIEEFMISANVAAAEMLEEKRMGFLYRVHDQPSVDRLASLRDFLATLDIKLAKGQLVKPLLFNHVLAQVRGQADEMLVNEAVLRSQAQAEYARTNIGHFGLNLARYAHFTSPIRRYADLIVHRALIRAFKLGADGLDEATLGELDGIATQISIAERRAATAERETIDRIIATLLAGQIGEVFSARINGLTKAGLFVSLTESGADGLVPMGFLGRDDFRLDERRREIKGRRSGVSWRQGDLVEVRLVEAQPVAGALRFEVLSRKREKPTTDARKRKAKTGQAGAHPRAQSEPEDGKGKSDHGMGE